MHQQQQFLLFDAPGSLSTSMSLSHDPLLHVIIQIFVEYFHIVFMRQITIFLAL